MTKETIHVYAVTGGWLLTRGETLFVASMNGNKTAILVFTNAKKMARYIASFRPEPIVNHDK